MRRRTAIFGLLLFLTVLAGCSSIFGPGEPDQARLTQNASYDWETPADVSLTLKDSSVTSVYNVSNRSTLELYIRDDLGRERYLQISALRYRYANGTTITSNNSLVTVEQTRKRTTLTLPNESGSQVGFTALRHGKQFTRPVYVEGSYTVRLPRTARVGVPLLSRVTPGNYRTDLDGDYMTIRWENVTSQSLHIRWYLDRDLLLFAGLFAVAVLLGSGGAVYYYRQIRRLRRRRDETDIDIDVSDDSGDGGPPPGMR